MAEETLLFNETTAKKFIQSYSSNDKGYKVKNQLNMTARFTPELAEILHCHENFFTGDNDWRDGVTTAGLPVVIENAVLALYEIDAMKKADPIFTFTNVGLSAFSVFDDGGSPAIAFVCHFEKDGARFAKFMESRKFFHGNVRATANQDALDFGVPAAVEEGAEGSQTELQDGSQEDLEGTASDVYNTGSSGPVTKALKDVAGKSKPKASKKKKESKPKRGAKPE